MLFKFFIMSFVLISVFFIPSKSICGESDGNQTLEIEEITVTANKIIENPKDIPQSISVIDEYTVQDKGIKNVADIIKEIPNLSSSFLYSEDVNFRGLNSSTFTNNNPVVLYIDGIPQSNRYSFDASLSNVERVEVLRGPQGTIYGKDSIGAVINIITKTPKNYWQGTFNSEYASYNSMLGTFNLNGPILKDKFFIGINGKLSKDDGWITNHYPGNEEDANRKNEHKLGTNMVYKPNEKLDIKLTLSSDYQKNYWINGGLAPSGTNVYHYSRDDAEETNFDRDTYTKTQSDSQAINISYDLNPMLFNSVTTHKKIEMDGDYDFDWGNNPIFENLYQFQHSTIDNWTQELRLSSQNKTGIRWVAGLYYEKDTYSNDRYGMQYPGEFVGTPFDVDMDDVSETTSDTLAGFGQVIVPFAKKFEMTLGARYQEIEKEFDSNFYYLPIGMSGDPAYTLDAEHKWRSFLPKAGLSYKINDKWTTYISLASGYLPGGFNYWTMNGNEDDNRFDPQKSINYEIGLKSSFDRLNFNANVFYMDIKDIHVYEFNLNTGMIRTSNAGKAHSYGAELELNYMLTDRLELNSAFGIIQAEYDEYTSGEYDGNKIERTPSHTAKVGVQYTDPKGYYGRFDIRNQGKIYFNPSNNLQEESYTVADAKFGYKYYKWDIYGFVKNITDEEYVINISEQPPGNLVSFGERRLIGAGLRYSF